MFSISRMSTVQIYDANMGGVNFCEMLQNKQVLLPYCLLSTWNICHQWIVTLLQTPELKMYSCEEINYQCWNFKLLQQTIYDLLGNWLQHQDCHMEGHHSTPLLKRPQKAQTPTVPDPSNNTRFDKVDVPDPSNNTRFDKVDHFPVFQKKQQRCSKCRTGYSFIKCQKCGVALCL